MPIRVMDVLTDPGPWLDRTIVVAGDIVGMRPSVLVERVEQWAYSCWQDVVSPEEGLQLQFPGRYLCSGPHTTVGGLPITRCSVVWGTFRLSTTGLTRYMVADVSQVSTGDPPRVFTRKEADEVIDLQLQRCIRLGQSAQERAEAERRVREEYGW